MYEHGIKKVKFLADKLDKLLSKKAFVNFYWDRDMAEKSIKAKAYKKNEFENTWDYLKIILSITLVSDGYFLSDVYINFILMLVLPKPPI